ncbi:MAG: hypothetical protein ACLGJB_06695 [Blastocatellia bacterium]
MSKYGDLIKKARTEDRQKSRNSEIQNMDNEEMVNLGVKVSKARRRHWAAESKRKGISMTSVIIGALTKEFGEPE